MKKKIFGAALIAAMAVAAGWNYQQSKNETQLSDLAKANVEALAQGESSDYYKRCYPWIQYGMTYLVRDCTACGLSPADVFTGYLVCGNSW